ncbi:aldehyde oxidase [Egibacter rhizosphaerae]|uniref:Aldehyde oxidase n=1 Tax=Egibacter rhizosphaerae TaxID=1670831 RepID=A0A411YGQ1_9ACTN|nr:xanthine dehydrogenase family protein molybdopterin-binding subunit [Egibacter rhizosphaerae]QBI20383.1 aldehyde oxidase [Egibacter rhizosphaerae]
MSAPTAPTERTEKTGGWTGQSLSRKEDQRLLTGKSAFVDDRGMHNMGHAAFVRSPFAHAEIRSIDTTRAEQLPGVITILTGVEVAEQTDPLFQFAPKEDGSQVEEYLLAVGKARYQGDAVAVVLAESAEVAQDAAELVEVDYEPLPPVTDVVEAAEPTSPVLHESLGDNVAWKGEYDYGDIDWALESADHVVTIDRLHFHRFSSTPLECFGVLVDWDQGTDVIDIVSNNQFPTFAALVIAPSLRVGIDQLNFASQDIGGGFGIKINTYVHIGVLALLSRKAGRPVKWTEFRTEHHQSGGHGNERTFLDVQVPIMEDGTILGFKARAYDDAGAYLHYEPLGAVIWSQVLPGPYRFKHINVDYTECVTNKAPAVPNRGYSRMQHIWLTERIVDTVAHELGFDPVELRKHNYVQPEDYPYTTPNGCIYDSGDLPRALDLALEGADYPKWRERQREAAGTGKRIGIGIGTTLDSGTNNFGQSRMLNPNLPFSGQGEAATAKLDLYGEVALQLGTTPQGQGHETTAAQVAADILGLSPDQIRVHAGFNKSHSTYVGFSGTYASQFAVTGINAVIGATEKLRDEISDIASAVLGAPADEIELADGMAQVRGDPERALPFIGAAGLLFASPAELPPEVRERVSLVCRHVYYPPFEVPDIERKYGNLTLTYATQTHVAVVEVDEETGEVEILDYSVVDDCGTRLNPKLVEGQVHGAASHGIAAALQETMEYDEDGQLMTANFLHYNVARADDIPPIKTQAIESPSPFTGTGAKGMGEGGGAPLHALCSAIQDALGSGAPIVHDSHNPPERVLGLLRTARTGGNRGIRVASK